MEEHLKSSATKLHRIAEKILATKLLVDFMLAHTHETNCWPETPAMRVLMGEA